MNYDIEKIFNKIDKPDEKHLLNYMNTIVEMVFDNIKPQEIEVSKPENYYPYYDNGKYFISYDHVYRLVFNSMYSTIVCNNPTVIYNIPEFAEFYKQVIDFRTANKKIISDDLNYKLKVFINLLYGMTKSNKGLIKSPNLVSIILEEHKRIVDVLKNYNVLLVDVDECFFHGQINDQLFDDLKQFHLSYEIDYVGDGIMFGKKKYLFGNVSRGLRKKPSMPKMQTVSKGPWSIKDVK